MHTVLSDVVSKLAVTKGTVSGLGIDVGQQETKIVWLEKTRNSKSLHASAIRFPTDISPVEVAKEEDSMSMMGFAAQSTEPEKERRSEEFHPFRHRKNDSAKVSKWSAKDIGGLCDRIVNMIGTNFRMAPLHIALSMSVCDFRGVYLRKGSNGVEGSVAEALAESIGSREPRSLAILDSDPSKPKRRVFSLPQETALAFGDGFDRNGMPPMSMDGLPWCLSGCLPLTQRQRKEEVDFDGPQIVFDWSWGRPTLIALDNHEITYVRRLNNGSIQQLCGQAQADLELSNAQAVRWLTLCNASNGDRELMEDTRQWLELRASELAHELNEAIQYVAWKLKGGKIRNLWLTGGGAALGLANWIRSPLLCPVHVWNLETSAGRLGPEFAVATALAAKGVYDAV